MPSPTQPPQHGPGGAARARSAPESGTLAEVGEFALIDQLTEGLQLSEDAGVLIGPGDDAAVLRFGGDVAVSTDTLVEGVHFRTDWSLAHEIGQRAVAQAVADLEAMAARPTALVAAFTAPGDLAASWAKQCSQGMRLEAARSGSLLVGGDLTTGDRITITVTVLGDLQGRSAVRRSGARPGDVVAVCGRLGWSAAGLTVLSRGFRSPRAVVEAYKVPQVPYGQGRRAAEQHATAMIDVSDGLLADLGHIALASGVRLDLHRESFELPEPIRAVAAATGSDPWELVLTGGEDHALAATFPRGEVPSAEVDGWAWRQVGEVVEAPERTLDAGGTAETGQRESPEPAVTVDGRPWHGQGGWTHFR